LKNDTKRSMNKNFKNGQLL